MTSELRKLKMFYHGLELPFPTWDNWSWRREKIAAKAVTKTLTKPKMRGLLNAQINRNILMACLLSCLGGLAFKVMVADVRRQKYADYYRNLDAEALFEDMRKKKVFQSC